MGKLILHGVTHNRATLIYCLNGKPIVEVPGKQTRVVDINESGLLIAKDKLGLKLDNQLQVDANMVTEVKFYVGKLKNGIEIAKQIPIADFDTSEYAELVIDPATFTGILFSNIEIGTNILGWRKGVDSTSSLTPICAKFTFTNKTGKDIKYLTVDIRPYNAVGDPVECTVSGISLYSVKCTGPFENAQTYTQILESAWYNTTIETAKIEGVTAIYMDGTEQVLSADEFKTAPKTNVLSDNESRNAKQALGLLLMIVAGILDVISIFCIFSVSSAFSVLTTISTIAFFIGLYLRK